MKQASDLHGNAPDKSPTALLLIDVINDLDFPGNESLLRGVKSLAERLVRLKVRARKANVPIIYVNDNFGRWQSDFTKQVEHCLQPEIPGRILAERMKPEPNDYFVLKPKHSGFFSTTLNTLLSYLGVHTLILTGIAGDRCVLFTANDAYLRDYRLFVPRDCVLSNTSRQNTQALELMQRVLHADVRSSLKINLSALQKIKTKHL
jgi:nicotinamidase-related amidase